MLGPLPANYFANINGDVPPAFGGAIAEAHATIGFDYVDGSVAMYLPAGAEIVNIRLVVNTAFDGGATLSVGDDSSTTYYLSAASVLGSLGPVYSTAWLTNGKWFTELLSGANINVSVGGSPTVGSAVLIVEYVMRNS